MTGAGCSAIRADFAAAMTYIRTPRLQLEAIDVAEAERIVARSAGPTDSWADDFPFEGDLGAVGGSFAPQPPTESNGRSATTGSPAWPTSGPSGGSASRVSQIGGGVEIGYGLAPSARRHGYAAEAVIALLTVAADHGLSRVTADTTLDNIASRRTLIRAGFRLVSTDAELHRYEVLLNGDPPRSR